jgi:hypothetical protein
MQPAIVNTIFDEVTDFLGTAPSAESIMAFQPSAELAARAHELLSRNRTGSLTPNEQAELDEFIRIEHFMVMLKLKARRGLKVAE